MPTAYHHIARNQWRIYLLTFLFALFLAVQGYCALWLYFFCFPGKQTYAAAAAAPGDLSVFSHAANAAALKFLPWVFALGLLWMLIAYYRGDRMLLHAAGALRAEWDEAPHFFRLVDNLCVSQGMLPPSIYIINDNSLNCFSVGRNAQHASLAVTKGLIKKLERAELEGVVAHELSHLQRGDVGLMTVTAAGVSCFTHIAENCSQGMVQLGPICGSSAEGPKSANIIFAVLFVGCAAGWVFFTLYGYLFVPLTRLALSRRREYLADASAALMTRYPSGLISALYKIQEDSRVEILDYRPTMAALCIANPLSCFNLFASMSGLLAVHPPIEERVRALRDMDSGY